MPIQTTQPSSASMLPHAVIRTLATRRALHPSIPTGEVNHEESTRDVQAFCALLARIMMRCLKERDERIMQVVTSAPQTEA